MAKQKLNNKVIRKGKGKRVIEGTEEIMRHSRKVT